MQIMDWYPFLKPVFRRLPSRISGIQDKIIYLKNLEETLWKCLLENAKTNIKDGKMNPSMATTQCITLLYRHFKTIV
jgi:hypothetical protein